MMSILLCLPEGSRQTPWNMRRDGEGGMAGGKEERMPLEPNHRE
jgi:hypothetical protein